jgi:hypothetical protein
MQVTPLASARSSDRPRKIPQAVKAACRQMVYESIDFIAAARANGLKPDTLRRWLHTSEAVGLLRRERSTFRESINASNEGALKRIRDESANAMAQIGAIRTLEGLQEGEVARLPGSEPAAVRITIIGNQVAVTPPASSVPLGRRLPSTRRRRARRHPGVIGRAAWLIAMAGRALTRTGPTKTATC